MIPEARAYEERIWHNYRRKNTDGLPGTMLILWSICKSFYSLSLNAADDYRWRPVRCIRHCPSKHDLKAGPEPF
jgi:hypothetical protein